MVINLLYIILSNNFEKTGKIEIGLSLVNFVLFDLLLKKSLGKAKNINGFFT